MKMGCLKRVLLSAAALVSILVAFFFLVYRPWQRNWGATAEEIRRTMPGDEMVGEPDFNATRAVTVNAPPERIWPWLMQMGYKRAGFYSWDRLDNDGIPSAERILPEYQGLKVGDLLPLSTSASATVAQMEPGRHLLLVFPAGEPATWVWGLYPIDSGRTRLVSRLRVELKSLRAELTLDAFEIIMMRKHLLEIKRRAERPAEPS